MRRGEGYHRLRGNWRPNERQRRVLDLLLEGRTNAEIAQALGITLDGAKWHLGQLMAETGTSDRDALAAWWRDLREEQERRPALVPWLPRLMVGGAALAGAVVLLGVAFDAIRGAPGGDAVETAPTPLAADIGLDAPPTPQPTPVPDPGAPPPCDLPLPPDFTLVSADELREQGLVEIGPVVAAELCLPRVSNRDDRSIIWLADGGALRADLSAGLARPADLTAVRAGQVGRFTFLVGTTAVFLDVTVAGGDDVLADYVGQAIELGRMDTDGTFLAFYVSTASSDVSRRPALSSEGILFVEPFPIPRSGVIDQWTGERIPTDGLRELMTVDLSPSSDFAFTACDHATSLCTVVYRPYTERLRAPGEGHLRCLPPEELEVDLGGKLAGVIELDAGDFVLLFRQVFATSPSAVTIACEPQDVQRGEVISGHNHFRISARTPDGSALSVVIGGDGTLYVGEVAVRLGCPCAMGH